MTGAYLRVKRGGKFENVEVEHLTDEERELRFSGDTDLSSWFNLVCNKLAEAEVVLEETKVVMEEAGVVLAEIERDNDE